MIVAQVYYDAIIPKLDIRTPSIASGVGVTAQPVLLVSVMRFTGPEDSRTEVIGIKTRLQERKPLLYIGSCSCIGYPLLPMTQSFK